MSDVVFADGLIIKRRENAPDFVIANLSVKVSEFVAFLQQHEKEGWVNIDVKMSKGGKMYASLDTWQPTQGQAGQQGIVEANKAAATPSNDFADDGDVPF